MYNHLSYLNWSEVTDPDQYQHPELFEVRRYTEAELQQHRETYQLPVSTPYGTFKSGLPTNDSEDSHFIIKARHEAIAWSETSVRRSDLKDAGWKLRTARKGSFPVTRIVPHTWVDTETGEVITTNPNEKSARRVSKAPPTPESMSDRCIRYSILLNALSPNKREFVQYIIKMRSRRGGLVEPLTDALDRWIAYRHPEILQNNKARKRQSLKGLLYTLGILADEQTLTREHQLAGWSTKADKLAEASTAATILRPRGVPQWEQGASRPTWMMEFGVSLPPMSETGGLASDLPRVAALSEAANDDGVMAA